MQVVSRARCQDERWPDDKRRPVDDEFYQLCSAI